METVCDHCKSLMVPAGTTEYKDEVHVVFKCSLYAAVKTSMHNWFGGEGRVRGGEGGGAVYHMYMMYMTRKVRRGKALLC